MVPGDDGDGSRHDKAYWVRCASEALSAGIPEAQIEPFLSYLQEYPLGIHNRRAAEAVERLLYLVGDDHEREKLSNRLRSLRDQVAVPC